MVIVRRNYACRFCVVPLLPFWTEKEVFVHCWYSVRVSGDLNLCKNTGLGCNRTERIPGSRSLVGLPSAKTWLASTSRYFLPPAVTSQALQGKNARQECLKNRMCMFSLTLVSRRESERENWWQEREDVKPRKWKKKKSFETTSPPYSQICP
jgi:hypothetical protein